MVSTWREVDFATISCDGFSIPLPPNHLPPPPPPPMRCAKRRSLASAEAQAVMELQVSAARSGSARNCHLL